MSYEKMATLPMTGAGITLFGVFFGQMWLLAVAVAFIAVGAALLRLGWRRGLPAGAPTPAAVAPRHRANRGFLRIR